MLKMIAGSQCIYKGEQNENSGVPHGKGIAAFTNGNYFEGTFQDGAPFGTGRLVIPIKKYAITGNFTENFEPKLGVIEIEFFDHSYFKGNLMASKMFGVLKQPNGDS